MTLCTAAERVTPARRPGRSSGGQAGVEGGVEDVAGQRLHGRVDAAEHVVARRHGKGAVEVQPVVLGRGQLVAHLGGQGVDAGGEPVGGVGDGGAQQVKRGAGEVFGVGGAAEGGADVVEQLGDGGGFDAGLPEPGAGDFLAFGHVDPFDLDGFGQGVRGGRRRSRVPVGRRVLPRSSRDSQIAFITVVESTGTGTETPVARRILSWRRMRTSSTMPSMPLSSP